ncbi:hypothetical protein CEUSTIGMA_g151.t1 [Chlamydomonas eustigma]|uniref:Glycosyltransferase n=1 Tax=Chlamydomonas eustigma TaxID=1157962 RepID=A0A250WPD0_9CHLO|nr:hypothetical protein CEUSTIGMA_g151.t1 [Chlamydomonas eustigma]|eukprot:GAX72695.1 hypothetical protein CEUSTIGMA_g151.t1 [Chlamydomonas eustigma]
MSLSLLREVVNSAVWQRTIETVPRRAVMLSTCDIYCFQNLLEPFLWALEHSRDGDLTRHLVLVGNGVNAFLHCDKQRSIFKHQCVLDSWCLPPQAGFTSASNVSLTPDRASFKSPLYFYALVQKMAWATEVVQLGVSVLWVDLDITLFADPMKFLFTTAPDADVVLNSEDWGGEYSFNGDVCKYPDPTDLGRLCSPGSVPYRLCCHTRFNGGVWLVNPTDNGVTFLKTWYALLFEDSVVKGKMWNKTSIMDQDILSSMVKAAVRSTSNQGLGMNATFFKWDPLSQRYLEDGKIIRSRNETFYLISGTRINSLCGGQCGWKWNASFSSHWQQPLKAWRGDGYNFYWQGSEVMPRTVANNSWAKAELPEQLLVCVMPKIYADAMIGFHQNCLFEQDAVLIKRKNMIAWRHWAVEDNTVPQDASGTTSKNASASPAIHIMSTNDGLREAQGLPQLDDTSTLNVLPAPLTAASNPLGKAAYQQHSGSSRHTPPLYIVTSLTGSEREREGLRRLYASMQFSLVHMWIVVHGTDDPAFEQFLDVEIDVLNLLYGHIKILETCLSLGSMLNDGSKNRSSLLSATRNRGLDIIGQAHGLVYFIDADNIVHPNLWYLLVTELVLGNIYAFDQYREPETGSVASDTVTSWSMGNMDVCQFVFDVQQLNGLRFDDRVPEQEGLSGFLSALSTHHHPTRRRHIHEVASFYRFNDQKFKALYPDSPNNDAGDGVAAVASQTQVASGRHLLHEEYVDDDMNGHRHTGSEHPSPYIMLGKIGLKTIASHSEPMPSKPCSQSSVRRQLLQLPIGTRDSAAQGCGSGTATPFYIITPVPRHAPTDFLRHTFASLHFHLLCKWIVVDGKAEDELQSRLGPETFVLNFLYGGQKVLEVTQQLNAEAHHIDVLRNKGLEMLTGQEGIAHFLEASNLVHPQLWGLATAGFLKGHLYTFDQYMKPPATVRKGNVTEQGRLHLSQFAFDIGLVRDTKFSEDRADDTGDQFATSMYTNNPGTLTYVEEIAAFNNASGWRFFHLIPAVPKNAWTVYTT